MLGVGGLVLIGNNRREGRERRVTRIRRRMGEGRKGEARQ